MTSTLKGLHPSPRAAPVEPFQGSIACAERVPRVRGVPRPWADLFGPFRAKTPTSRPDEYPGKHALGGDRQAFAVGPDELQEPIGPGLDVLVDQHLTGLIDETDVHRSRMQIDATIEWMLLLVKPHHGSPWKREVVEPA